jgi:hypothetical protein
MADQGLLRRPRFTFAIKTRCEGDSANWERSQEATAKINYEDKVMGERENPSE